MPYIGNVPKYGDTASNFKTLDDIKSYVWTFDASFASNVDITNDTLIHNSHRFVQGQRVTYNNGGGTSIGGLTSGNGPAAKSGAKRFSSTDVHDDSNIVVQSIYNLVG